MKEPPQIKRLAWAYEILGREGVPVEKLRHGELKAQIDEDRLTDAGGPLWAGSLAPAGIDAVDGKRGRYNRFHHRTRERARTRHGLSGRRGWTAAPD